MLPAEQGQSNLELARGELEEGGSTEGRGMLRVATQCAS